MTRWPRRWQHFRVSKAAPERVRPGILLLEHLEDRCVPAVGFTQVNLASDVAGLARVLDPALSNPWGLSFSPTGPFWLSENGHGLSDLLDGRGEQVPLTVSVPGVGTDTGSPTSTVFNPGDGFVVTANGLSAPGQFLFATEDGTISAWAPAVDPINSILALDNSATGADYKGLALTTDAAGRSTLYAADLSHATIDVFDENFQAVSRPGAFQDPTLPNDYGPVNIQNIGDKLYVSYAQQDDTKQEPVLGAGHGFVDVYDTAGALLSRVASRGVLDAPWGLAQAPARFGPFGGALLVGNLGDGRINAFDPNSGALLGTLADENGQPLELPGLWALKFGNDHEGGDSNTLFFTQGLDDGHGLFGAIQSPEKKGADTGGAGVFDPNFPGERKDYPLPPANGPTLQTSRAQEHSHPITVLLPLNEASLVLAPTILTATQFNPPSEASVANNGYVPVVFTPSSGSSSVLSAVDTTSSRGAPQPEATTLALNSFLDLQAGPARPEIKAEHLPRETVSAPSALLPAAPVIEVLPSPRSDAPQAIYTPSAGESALSAPAELSSATVLEESAAVAVDNGGSHYSHWSTLYWNAMGAVSVVAVWACLPKEWHRAKKPNRSTARLVALTRQLSVPEHAV